MKAACEQERLARQAQAELLTHLQQEVTVRQRKKNCVKVKKLAQFFGSCASGCLLCNGKPYYANQTATDTWQGI